MDDTGYDPVIGAEGLAVYQQQLLLLCGEDQKVYEYVCQYLASIVQCPYNKTGVCIVFKSDEGTGKTTMWDYNGKCIMGADHYVSSEKPSDFVGGSWNDAGENKILVCLDDTSQKSTFLSMDEIKSWVTKKEGPLRIKYKNTKTNVRDYSNIIFCTNRTSIITIQPSDRRFMIVDSSNKYADINPDTPIEEKLAYKKSMYQYLDSDNPCPHTLIAVRDFLYGIDVSKFNPQADRVLTDAYRRLKSHSIPAVLRFISEFTNNEKFIYMTRPSIYIQYKEWCTNYNPKGEMCGRNTFYSHMEEYYTTKSGFITLTKTRDNKEYYRWDQHDVRTYMTRRNMCLDEALHVPDSYKGVEDPRLLPQKPSRKP
jgi:hypothetical protein